MSSWAKGYKLYILYPILDLGRKDTPEIKSCIRPTWTQQHRVLRVRSAAHDVQWPPDDYTLHLVGSSRLHQYRVPRPAYISQGLGQCQGLR